MTSCGPRLGLLLRDSVEKRVDRYISFAVLKSKARNQLGGRCRPSGQRSARRKNGPKKPKFKPFLESYGENSELGMFRMVRLRISAALKRSFRVLVIFPLIITGLAFTCAAVCLSFLTVLSLALGHHDVESRLASAQLLPRSDLWNGTTADLMNAPDELQQGVQFISFESRFSSAQPLLRSDFRNGATASLASVPNALPQGFQFIRLDAQPWLRWHLRSSA